MHFDPLKKRVFRLLAAGLALAGCSWNAQPQLEAGTIGPRGATAETKPALAPGFDQAFFVPDVDLDQHGNPVVARDGTRMDAATGWAFEMWLREPRVELVLVPSGNFNMGSPDSEPGRSRYEGPLHRVAFAKPFYIGKYEVTQGQWEVVMGSNPSSFLSAGKNAPVERVSWKDCEIFVERLNSLVASITFRLPSEAEWEYACRAGTTTAIYTGPLAIREPWVEETSELDEIAWYKGNSRIIFEGDADKVGRVIRRKKGGGWPDVQNHRVQLGTRPVGKKKPNALGLYDMLGNVWEWCEDVWHDNYMGAPTDGSAWVSERDVKQRVCRGGSWDSYDESCRSATRCERSVPRDDITGFRLVVSPRNP